MFQLFLCCASQNFVSQKWTVEGARRWAREITLHRIFPGTYSLNHQLKIINNGTALGSLFSTKEGERRIVSLPYFQKLGRTNVLMPECWSHPLFFKMHFPFCDPYKIQQFLAYIMTDLHLHPKPLHMPVHDMTFHSLCKFKEHPSKSVMEIGCGVGLFSFLAILAGVNQAYAYDFFSSTGSLAPYIRLAEDFDLLPFRLEVHVNEFVHQYGKPSKDKKKLFLNFDAPLCSENIAFPNPFVEHLWMHDLWYWMQPSKLQFLMHKLMKKVKPKGFVHVQSLAKSSIWNDARNDPFNRVKFEPFLLESQAEYYYIESIKRPVFKEGYAAGVRVRWLTNYLNLVLKIDTLGPNADEKEFIDEEKKKCVSYLRLLDGSTFHKALDSLDLKDTKIVAMRQDAALTQCYFSTPFLDRACLWCGIGQK